MYSDKEILELLKKEKEKGTKELINKYESYIEHVCEKILHNKEDIKECVNDVILDLCMNYDNYDEKKGSLKNYIHVIAQRTAIDRYRKNIRRHKMEEEIYEKYQVNQLDKIQEEYNKKRIEEAMDKLPSIDKKILSMHYIDNLSYKEISDEIGMNYENVRKRGARGKKKLLYLILLGLLLFGVSASAIITMEKQGVLQELIPFFEEIKSEDDENVKENNRKENVIKKIYGPLKKEIEIEKIEEEKINNIYKYQYSSNKGIIRTEKSVYEMIENKQKHQIGDIIYEIKNIFYYNGEWEFKFLITCLDMDYVKIDGIDENSSIEDFIYADNNRTEKWGHAELDYLEKAYIITPDDKKMPLKSSGLEMPSLSEPNIIIATLSSEGYLDSEEEEEKNIKIILPDGQEYKIVLRKLELKEYVEQNKNKQVVEKQESQTTEEEKEDSKTETTEEEIIESETGNKEEEKKIDIKIGTDIAVVKDGIGVVNLYQKEAEEYVIADLITADHFGVPRENNRSVKLRDEEGNIYNRIRISKSIEEKEDKINYEIYFRGIDPGVYYLNIPYLCLQKDMTTEKVKFNLPKEEGRIDYDEIVLFPDGSGFHITGIILHENIEEVYYWDGVQTSVEEKIVYYYEIEYEPISIGKFQYNTAKVSGLSSDGISVNTLAPVIDGKTIYAIRSIDEKKMDTVELYFYDPTYYLDHEYSFEVNIKEERDILNDIN